MKASFSAALAHFKGLAAMCGTQHNTAPHKSYWIVLVQEVVTRVVAKTPQAFWFYSIKAESNRIELSFNITHILLHLQEKNKSKAR